MQVRDVIRRGLHAGGAERATRERFRPTAIERGDDHVAEPLDRRRVK
jgi:hypothetical protein